MNKAYNSILRIISVLLVVFFFSFTLSCSNPGSESTGGDSNSSSELPNSASQPTPVTNYTITFNANNEGVTGTTTSITAAEGTIVTLTTNGFSLNGYNFSGWNTAANGSGSGFADGASVRLTGNLTLYAQWILVTVPKYEINLTQSENGAATVSQIYSTAGTEITITVTPDELYALDNISVKDDDNNQIAITESQPGSNIYTFTMPESKVFVSVSFKYVAFWIKVIISRLNSNQYTSSMEGEVSSEGNTLRVSKIAAVPGTTIKAIVVCNKNYEIFQCGIEEDSTPLKYQELQRISNSYSFVMPNNNVTVLFWYKPKTYDVNFETYSSIKIPSQKVETGEKVSAVDDPADNEKSEGFLGWYTEPECINAFDFDTPIKKDTNLYAKWRRFKITMNEVNQKLSSLKYSCEIEINSVPSIGTGYNDSIKNALMTLYSSKPEIQIDLSLIMKRSDTYEWVQGNLVFNYSLIGDNSFENCLNLKTVNISGEPSTDGIGTCLIGDSIGEEAFKNCENLTTVQIGSGTEIIKKSAFENCKNLTEVKAQTSIIEIGNNAFKGCENLSGRLYTSRNGCTVGNNAFQDCTSLTYLPDYITTVGDYAFKGCASLRWFNIDITKIGSHAFEGCIKLSSVHFSSSTTIEEIGSYAFKGCKLSSATLPNTVSEIAEGTFSGCSFSASRNKVTIGTGVTKIGDKAFEECWLSEINIPSNVLEIGKGAFLNCHITKISFEDTDSQWYIKDTPDGEVLCTITISDERTNANLLTGDYVDKYWIKVE